MRRSILFLVQASLIAALYAALSILQNILIPGSATWAIQMRAAEALCILAFFTPAAIPGLALGCLLFNLTQVGALPLDFLIGTAASALAAAAMYLTRNLRFKNVPVLGLAMPALLNGLLIGWELSVYVGGGFWLNAAYVAAGELLVMAALGFGLYIAIRRRHIDELFRLPR